MRTTTSRKALLIGWLVLPVICAILFAAGCGQADAASTGLSAKDIRTAAPTNCINLDGGVVPSEGTSINLLKADAKWCINGTLAQTLGGPPPACAAGQHVTSSGTPPVFSCTADTGSVTFPACVHPGRYLTSDGGTAYCADDNLLGLTCSAGYHVTATVGVPSCTKDAVGGGDGFGAPTTIPNSGNTNTAGSATTSAKSDHIHACTLASDTLTGCVSTAAQVFQGDKRINGVVTSKADPAKYVWDATGGGGGIWSAFLLGSDAPSGYGIWHLYDSTRNVDQMSVTSHAAISGSVPSGDLGVGTVTTYASCPGCLTQQTWVAPTLPSGVTNTGAPYMVSGYFRDTQSVVHLRGTLTMTSGAGSCGGCGGCACDSGCDIACNYGYTCTANVCTIGAGASDLLDLPSGYRPSALVYFGTSNFSCASGVKISAAGRVSTVGTCASTTAISLDGITFDTR